MKADLVSAMGNMPTDVLVMPLMRMLFVHMLRHHVLQEHIGVQVFCRVGGNGGRSSALVVQDRG